MIALYHNPNCGSSKNALAILEDSGADFETVLYLKNPPDRRTLEAIVAGLEDPLEDLVRKDSHFAKLGLDPDDYVDSPKAVVDILLEHPRLLQRPLIVRDGKAIIGRPKDRVAPFIS